METMRHDFPIEAQYPPLQKLLNVLNVDGVPLPDATGGCFLAILVKRGLGRVLKLKRIIGQWAENKSQSGRLQTVTIISGIARLQHFEL